MGGISKKCILDPQRGGVGVQGVPWMQTLGGGDTDTCSEFGAGGCRDVPCSRVGLFPFEGWWCHRDLLEDCFAFFFFN